MTKYRLFCKTCVDYTLHIHNGNETFTCKCNTLHSDINISEIPTDIVLKQQKRYKEYRSRLQHSTYNIVLKDMFGQFASNNIGTNVLEDDAGLIEQENKIKQERIAERNRKIDYLNSFKGINRNETCRCGSGKKYKKCCSDKVNEILLLNL